MPDPAAAAAPPDLSVLALVLHAGPVVQGIMALLALASLASWAVILEKALLLGRLTRQAGALAAAASAPATPIEPAAPADGLTATVLGAGTAEWRLGRDAGETAGEHHARLERAMAGALAAALRRAEPGLPLLATIGSVAPFVGLLGTVWGIMHSFSGIAARQDTSLAVVAPGIAEALFATALGLVAAIPAVVGYNRCVARMRRIRQEGGAAVGALATRLARQPPPAAPAAVAAVVAPVPLGAAAE